MIHRLSHLFLRTLRDDPADAEVPSHKLLVRAGYIRRAAPGGYTWLPLGWEIHRKVENIVREVGKTVSLRLHTAIDGARRFQGILAAATPQEITLHILPEGKRAEARSITIDIANIDRAKTVFVWAAAPKPGSPEARKAAELEAQFAALEANASDDSDDSDDEFEDDFETKHSDTANTEATAS